MIYFLWSLLNLGALVWFLFICFSDLKGIKEKLGTASAIIFVVCSLSFIKESLSNKSQVFPVEFLVIGQEVKTKSLKSGLFFNLDLMYGNPKDSLGKDMLGVTVTNGLVVGHLWKPLLTKVYLKDGIIHYISTGTHEWKLLGLTLYDEPEKFTGIIE